MSNSEGLPPNKTRLLVGVDVGGTFTDVCVIEQGERGDRLHVAKTESTPADLAAGILGGLRDAGVDLSSAALFVHGTTVATNALITRSFPRTVMITTAGFRDVIEIGRGTRQELYDPYVEDITPPYIRRRDRLAVSERIDSEGHVVEPLDETEARQIARNVARRGAASAVVCFVNSHRDPRHEQRMREILAEESPDTLVTLSSDVLPEIFEHDRFSTATVNAVLAPVVGGYVGTLDAKLRQSGSATDLLLLHSGGGVMSANTAQRFAARLASSGTAAGAIAVKQIGALAGLENVIGLDMGGTSADISLVHAGELRMTRDWSVEYGHPIRFPSIELLSIGAGGGSHAWIDTGGALRNGPQSAGAKPGPVCYGHGNTVPTNTDANLVLGRLGTSLIGGKVTLDREAAHEAIAQQIAKPMGLDVEQAANAILRVANANMADAIRKISIGRGYDPREFSLVAFGGAGPLHAADIARDLMIPRVIFPPNPGVASALGCLLVDVRHDLTRMHHGGVDSVDVEALEAAFRELEQQADELLAAENIDPQARSLQRLVDMRYVGQWRSLTVPMDSTAGPEALAAAVARFHEEYEREHRYRRADAPIEIYQIHVTAVGGTRPVDLPRETSRRHDATSERTRRVVFSDGTVSEETPIYDRESLEAGARFDGPAIVEQLDSTIVVPPGAHVEADELLNLRMELNQ